MLMSSCRGCLVGILFTFALGVAIRGTSGQSGGPGASGELVVRNFVLPEFPYHKVIEGVEGTLTINLNVSENGAVEKVLLEKYDLNAKDLPFGIIDGLLQKECLLKWTFERVGSFKNPPRNKKVILTYRIIRTNASCSPEPKYDLVLNPTISITVTGYMPRTRT